jgi:hypothetical protein
MANIVEEGLSLVGQHNMAWLASFAGQDREGARVGVEVIHFQPAEFTVACACLERGANELLKVRFAGLEESFAFGNG